MSAPDAGDAASYARPFKGGALVVFAKAPRVGLVKTRMSPPLSLEQAAELYSHLLDDVLAVSAECCAQLDLAPLLAVHPPEACAELAERVPGAFRVIAQRGHDLGARMGWAAAELAAGGVSPILLRGSDSPILDSQTLRQALEALESSDLVLCPDLDGGYNLVGLRAPSSGLFDHPMSTRSVLEDTLASARALGLRSSVLAPSFDLDTAADLGELARVRHERGPDLCPRTLSYLDEHDLWHHARTQTSVRGEFPTSS